MDILTIKTQQNIGLTKYYGRLVPIHASATKQAAAAAAATLLPLPQPQPATFAAMLQHPHTLPPQLPTPPKPIAHSWANASRPLQPPPPPATATVVVTAAVVVGCYSRHQMWQLQWPQW